jgi:hypothetical protein
MNKKYSYYDFIDSCGIGEDNSRIAKKMFDAIAGEEVDAQSMCMVLATLTACQVQLIREAING